METIEGYKTTKIQNQKYELWFRQTLVIDISLQPQPCNLNNIDI